MIRLLHSSISIVILAVSLSLFSCGGNQNAEEETSQTEEKSTQNQADSSSMSSEEVAEAYQCEMKCEGDKTYSEPGKCPECEMDMKKVQ